jgi:hypothetical protein
MKKLILSIAALALFATSAFAERYVMITHGEGKDPFWPVVQKGGEDAARAIGADFVYIYNPSADMADMASSIQAAAATQPDGMVISLPDPDAFIFGGGVSNEIDFLSEIENMVKKFVIGKVYDGVFLKPKYGDASGVRGAARLGRRTTY